MSEENLSRRALLTRADAVGAAQVVRAAAVDGIAAQPFAMPRMAGCDWWPGP